MSKKKLAFSSSTNREFTYRKLFRCIEELCIFAKRNGMYLLCCRFTCYNCFQKPEELRNNVLETVASFLATGLDSEKSIIFNQSAVSGHAELAWILNCVSRMGWLNRMTQFKDKAGADKEKASVGLYIYPNLMAADILLYKATHVPVGADQKQHLELSRDIAQKFNNDFNCKTFFLYQKH